MPGMQLSLSSLAAWVGAAPTSAHVLVQGVSIDSRQVQPGDLFVAIRGERFDGHDFVAEAMAKGAVAALTERPSPVEIPQLRVADATAALGMLARAWRQQFAIPTIAVAGSNGKSTVKEMLAAILHRAGPGEVLATAGNLNNHWGVPLTLLKLRAQHRFAVIEMGANAAGEITYLTSIAQPDIGLITNAGLDHIAGFGGAEGAAKANGEMLAVMDSEGTAILNADDSCFPLWTALAQQPVLAFGLVAPHAEVKGTWEASATGGRLRVETAKHVFTTELQLFGRHNGLNALGAAAAALTLGIPPTVIEAGLADVRPVKGRLQTRAWAQGARLIDDSYNANPSSLDAALAVLAQCPGERLLVLGDMAELGVDEKQWHQRAGEDARRAGVNRLFGIGELSRFAVKSFGPGGRHFSSQEALISALNKEAHPHLSVLVKGSRCMQLDRLVNQLAPVADQTGQQH